MHININFILLQEFDVEYYFICFILILKVKFISKMKWKCIFSKISPKSDPLREPVHSTNQAACRLAGWAQAKQADWLVEWWAHAKGPFAGKFQKKMQFHFILEINSTFKIKIKHIK